MSAKNHRFVVIHQHRQGSTTYQFEAPLTLEELSSLPTLQETLVDKLKIPFAPDKGEEMDLVVLEEEWPVIHFLPL